MKLGIFLPNWVGDVVMATPTLRALRQHFGPDTRMVGVLRPYLTEVLAGTPWLNAMLPYDPRGKQPAHRGRQFLTALRSERFDAVVLLTNSLRTAWLARLSGARQRVGYARSGRSLLLTTRLNPLKDGQRFVPTSTLDYYLQLAYALGCPTESPRMELATSAADERAADAIWNKFNLKHDRRTIVLNCSGAFGAAKLWPPEYFAELARRLATEQGHDVLTLCGPSEREIARQIVQQAAHPRVHGLSEELLSIGLSKACVRRAGFMVTTDSGPRHFATAFEVPVLTLFGPTHIAWSETHDPRATHLQIPVDCGPCQRRACPLGHHRCMRDLSVDQVYRTAVQILTAQSIASRAA